MLKVRLNYLRFSFMITLLVVLWSSSYVGIRIGLDGYRPGPLALFRFLTASIAMLPFYFSLKTRQKVSLRQLPFLFLMGAIGIGLYNIFLNDGEMGLTAGMTSFIMGLMPLITVIFAIFFLKERASIYVFLGIAISLFGLGLIVWDEHPSMAYDTSMLLTLGAAICGAVYNIMQKPLLKHYHPIEIAAFIMWGGTLVLLFFSPQLYQEIKTAPLKATCSAIYLGIFSAAMGYALWSYVVQIMPASKAIVFLYLLPLVTMILSYIVLKELPPFISILGGSIAVLGAFFANYLHGRVETKTMECKETPVKIR